MADATGGARIVPTPRRHEVFEMVTAENGFVSRQILKIVHDDGDEKIEEKTHGQQDEDGEVGVGEIVATCDRLVENGRIRGGDGRIGGGNRRRIGQNCRGGRKDR